SRPRSRRPRTFMLRPSTIGGGRTQRRPSGFEISSERISSAWRRPRNHWEMTPAGKWLIILPNRRIHVSFHGPSGGLRETTGLIRIDGTTSRRLLVRLTTLFYRKASTRPPMSTGKNSTLASRSYSPILEARGRGNGGSP